MISDFTSRGIRGTHIKPLEHRTVNKWTWTCIGFWQGISLRNWWWHINGHACISPSLSQHFGQLLETCNFRTIRHVLMVISIIIIASMGLTLCRERDSNLSRLSTSRVETPKRSHLQAVQSTLSFLHSTFEKKKAKNRKKKNHSVVDATHLTWHRKIKSHSWETDRCTTGKCTRLMNFFLLFFHTREISKKKEHFFLLFLKTSSLLLALRNQN